MRETIPFDLEEHVQYAVKDLEFAVFRTPDLPLFTRLGGIRDVSEGGLTFYYGAGFVETNGLAELEIPLHESSNTFPLKLPCKVVYDIGVPDTGVFSPTRCCEVQFGELSQDQRAKLRHFIRKSFVSAGKEHI